MLCNPGQVSGRVNPQPEPKLVFAVRPDRISGTVVQWAYRLQMAAHDAGV